MQFNSIHFLIFFPVVLLVYLVIPAKVRYIWLLLASYYFYMSWNPVYALLIAFSTIITYLCSCAIGMLNPERERHLRRFMLITGLVANLGVLFVFKYFNFAFGSVNAVMTKIGLPPLSFRVDFVLPVGISFYTFQALGYMIDVYRGDTPVEKNPLRYALFVSFFPQLVAGPIERSGNLLSQLKNVENIKLLDYDRIVNGFSVMLWGFFMKVVVADRAAVIVNHVFDNWWHLDALALVLGTVFFAVQIYCDFAGYSAVAIGAAGVMGFKLTDNFKTPYFAVSIQDFWRRWHITLSTWFRDYVYIPLGGNRHGKARKYLNLMLTQLLSGLWHGASWTYVVWGGIHGLYQVAGDITKRPKERLCRRFGVNTHAKSFRILKVAATFCLVNLAWIFFRAPSLAVACRYIARIFTHIDPWNLTNGSLADLGIAGRELNILLISIAVLTLVDFLQKRKNRRFDSLLENQNIWFRPAVLLVIAFTIIIFGAYGMSFDPQQFIYFQF